MLHVIAPDTHLVRDTPPFRIRRIRPGLGIEGGDTGFHGLGLVDRARLSAGLVVGMHEHRDDEIVSYLRSGALVHRDSTGREEEVRADRLMVMNAGRGFSHEERLPEGEDVHMLQIFVRPREAGLEPGVQFAPLDEGARRDGWRLLVAPEGEEAPATVRQAARLLDMHLDAGATTTPPAREGWDAWLHVFAGRVRLEVGTTLAEGASLAATEGTPIGPLLAEADADLVLLQLDPGAPRSLAGTLSRGR